ncbi:MAG: ABC-F family ATP-binding cassette domain-containing protein, partial [Rhodospirillales bacterium]
MAPPILTLRDIHLTFGGTPLLEGAELAVSAGERLCLVGRNGSGKSTLLKIAAGEVAPDNGERFVQPGTTLRYLPQEPDLSGFATTLAYVEAGLGPNDDPHAAQYQIEKLGLAGTKNPAALSGGEARRCALARVLAPAPDVLLLDEPTNHLDLPAIEWLEDTLKSLRSAIVMVSHDRRFLENLSRTTVWIYNGESHRLDQGFGQFENWRDGMLEQAETERHKLKRKIHAETEWLHKGVTARRKRNQGRLRALQDLRKQQRAERGPAGSVTLSASQADASGKLVIEARDLEKAYGEQQIVGGFSLRVLRGEKIGFVGPNGAGKTTLLNLITGALKPDSGKVKLGANLETVTLDQGRESLDPGMPLADVLTGGGSDMVSVGGTPRHVASYMKDFLFDPVQARTPVGALSGGERGRVMLARALARPSNLLILDEPTNDLDLETLDLLQEMLSDYAGTVLLVSHDRDFLDRIVTSTVAWEGPGRW